MRRQITEAAKIGRCADQSSTEMMHPKSIDKDSRREGVISPRQPASERLSGDQWTATPHSYLQKQWEFGREREPQAFREQPFRGADDNRLDGIDVFRRRALPVRSARAGTPRMAWLRISAILASYFFKSSAAFWLYW